MIKLPYLILWCVVALALLVTFAVLFSIEHKKAPCVPAGCPGCENLTECHTAACTANELIGKVNSDPIVRKEIAKKALLERTEQLLTDTAVFNAIVQHPILKGKLECPPKPKSGSKTLMIVLLVVGGLVIVGLILFFLLRRKSSPQIPFSPVRSVKVPKPPALQDIPLRARSPKRRANSVAKLSPSDLDRLYLESGASGNLLLDIPKFNSGGGHMNWRDAAALEGGHPQLLLA
jgi:hypothetical protein